MTVVSTNEKPLELLVAKLTVGLILLGTLSQVFELHGCDACWVQRVNIGALILLAFVRCDVILAAVYVAITPRLIVERVLLLIFVRENRDQTSFGLAKECANLFCIHYFFLLCGELCAHAWRLLGELVVIRQKYIFDGGRCHN